MKKIFDIFEASDSADDRLVYAYDSSGVKGDAQLVVWSRDVLDIRKLISLANRLNFHIVPRGAGTGLVAGAVPQEAVVLDLSRMNKIIKFNFDESIVVVEPGVILNDLNNILQKHGLFFPVIPSSHKVCTIGGMIATNAAGNRALRYGRTSDWIKSIEIVDGTGKHIPIKDPDKFIGTEGTAAIIVNAELKLAPLIVHTTLDKFLFDDITDLMEKVQSLLKNSALISLEFTNKVAAKIAETDFKYFLFAEYEDDSGKINNPEEIQAVWQFRESFGQILASSGYVITEDPKIPLDKMSEFLAWLSNNKIPAFGHIGAGIIHPRFKENSHLIKEMFEFVDKIGGEVTGEHGIGLLKKEFASREFKQKIVDLKKKYDPKDILNRGKVI